MKPTKQIYETPRAFIDALAKHIIDSIKIKSEKPFNIALSGGNTPKALFAKIAIDYCDSVNWNDVHFYWGDERCVPPDHADSNYKMANDYLLSKLQIKRSNIHRIHGESNPKTEAIRYADEIYDYMKSDDAIPVFDLILLGLGEDGHTASLFPDQMYLLSSPNMIEATTQPQSGQSRISYTPLLINAAHEIIFMVSGKAKAEKVRIILNEEAEAMLYPASYIQPEKGKLIWFLDKEAASLMSKCEV